MLGFDTETTGLDLYHGAKPFFVTVCDELDNQTFWEWDVDPLTREPIIPPEDIETIRERIRREPLIIGQNPNFDVAAMRTVGIDDWPWEKTRCTLLAAHLLSSDTQHDLTAQAAIYLGIDISLYEIALRKATQEARRMVESKVYADKFAGWLIAKKGREDMPSADSLWKLDTWLPRTIAKALGYSLEHPWWTVLQRYSNPDSGVLPHLYKRQMEILELRGHIKIYEARLPLLSIRDKMEFYGVTVNGEQLLKVRKKYREDTQALEDTCVNIAKSYGFDLTLPKGGRNGSLDEFVFEVMKLPVVKKTKKGGPSLDKGAMGTYAATLPLNSRPLKFVQTLAVKRQGSTACSFLDSYERFWRPYAQTWVPVHIVNHKTGAGWYVLHPSLNPTGTNTLRWSCSNPNEQNISKKKGFNIRAVFGPAPGREWWSLDAENIELRIPAYEAGEESMIELFERPNDPPYFGSNHLFFFDILHPEKFAEHGAKVKTVFESSWYQWTKNGNFAVQYGAQPESGTADRAYHIEGAQEKIQKRLGKIAHLSASMIAFANKHGYVETMPDKTVDPLHGYPLNCTRNKWGRVKPTVPLSYHVQGTAMWWMMKAMIRCQGYLDTLNALEGYPNYFIALQVHDELVFDFPVNRRLGSDGKMIYGNLAKVKYLKKMMAEGGNDIGVPTPVAWKYHESSWAEAIAV